LIRLIEKTVADSSTGLSDTQKPVRKNNADQRGLLDDPNVVFTPNQYSGLKILDGN
jgi:hypothetical protein